MKITPFTSSLFSESISQTVRDHFIEKYLNGDLSRAKFEKISYEGILFWNQEIRLPIFYKEKLEKEIPQLNIPFMMTEYIYFLHPRPADILRLSPSHIRSWFQSKNYLSELPCIYLLNQGFLLQSIQELLVSRFGYHEEVVTTAGQMITKANVSSSTEKARVKKQLLKSPYFVNNFLNDDSYQYIIPPRAYKEAKMIRLNKEGVEILE